MPILRIEHPTEDFATWKAAFDRDPAGRGKAGVQQYSIYQPVDNPRYVLIDLEFETVTQAERLLDTMKLIWSSGAAGPALGGEPRTQILETKEVTQILE
ncbi:hypothetical protein IV500_17890 [Paeniglutamicibacter antarcticus]|uniref:Cyclase n=1 Tax=Arthrobacter terrae TaxID=2935737 RepID=A0A931CQM3_9MICC|nr:hypothetical protein [Arthrobacter terrae]MBG0741242.1 hypothetical protein [Arthrobacter terrae]